MNSRILLSVWCLCFTVAPWLPLSAQTCDSACSKACCEPQVFELGEVIIVTNGLNQETRLLHEIQVHPLARTEDILSRMPGLNVLRRGNYALEPVYRGLNTRRLNITIDGMRMFEACTDKMDPVSAYLEPNNLSNIELNGGASGFFQGSTSGANLNIGLVGARFSDSVKWLTSVSARGQSVSDALGGSAVIERRAEKNSYRLNAVHKRSQNYRDGNGDIVRFSQYEKWNYSLSSAHRLNNGPILRTQILGDHAFDIGYPALPMDVAFAHGLLGAITIEGKPENNVLTTWRQKVYANLVQHAMDDTRRDQVAMHMDMPGETQTVGAFWEGTLFLSGQINHLLRLKLESYYNRSFAEMTMYPDGEQPMYMLTWPDIRTAVVGANVSDQFSISRVWDLSFGIRGEQQVATIGSDIGLAQISIFFPDYTGITNRTLVSGQGSLTGQWDSGISWRNTAAYGMRSPDNSEQFGYYLFNRQDGYDYIGDPFLSNEKSFQIESALDFETDYASISWSTFGYHFIDYITAHVIGEYQAMTIGATGVKQYQNLSSALMLGSELSAMIKTGTKLDWRLSMNYTYGTDYEGNALPQVSPFTTFLSGRYRIRGFSIQGEWTMNAAQNRVRSDFGEIASPAYQVVNLRLRQQVNAENGLWQITTGVENLLDAAYRNHLDWGGLLQPGRNIYMGISVSWQ